MESETIVKMKAGRELDALIAEKVMDWHKIRVMSSGEKADYRGFPPGIYSSTKVKKYSSDIKAVFEVVDKIKEKGYRLHLNLASEMSGGVLNGNADVGDWHCNVIKEENKGNHVYAKTATEAICKAVLLAFCKTIVNEWNRK